MEYKWIGAALVILSCGGFGFSLCAAQKQEEWTLRQLAAALDYMQCELQYRLTPLPELCRQAGQHGKGIIRQVFVKLAEELECQLTYDVATCMHTVLQTLEQLQPKTRSYLQLLGESMGRFDLDGQMKGLEAVRQQCREDIHNLTVDKSVRLRSYQTLGLCAGAALVILFI